MTVNGEVYKMRLTACYYADRKEARQAAFQGAGDHSGQHCIQWRLRGRQ